MRAEVVVRGKANSIDLWPYSEVAVRAGQATTLTVSVHDSRELVGVLHGLLARGLEVSSAQLFDGAVAIASTGA